MKSNEDHENQGEVRIWMSEEVWRRRQSRRQFLKNSSLGLAGLIGGPALLAACGGGDGDEEASGGATGGETIRMINYVDWVGKEEIPTFTAATGIKVRQIVINSDEARIAKLAADNTAADMLLLDPSDGGRLEQLGLLAELNLKDNIPNYYLADEFSRKVDPFTEEKQLGIPSDYGRDGFVYRTDLVSEDLTTWKDVFDVAPKYSGKINLLDFESDTISSTLIGLGIDPNSQDEGDLRKASDALIAIKPHLKALVTTDMLTPLLDGSGVIAMDWDFDAYNVLGANPEVPLKWVDAEDGLRAYLDAWSAVKTTEILPAVQMFMNNHLDPKVYAEFVNTLGISVLVADARPYIRKEIQESTILFPPKDVQDRITFSLPRGEAQKFWDDAWARFKAA